MYSIVSWSPSQSEPLTVSYMCHSQESSPMLPSAAPTPPCAATVCERVGNTLESTATFKPPSESSNAARSPAPPPPTTTPSNYLFAVATALRPPENLNRPGEVSREQNDDEHLEC